MQTESQVVAIGHVIQLAVAPVFLLTGVSGLLAVLTNRLARIIDRARTLEDRLARAPQAEQGGVENELRQLSRRARLIKAFLSTDLSILIGLVFTCSMLALFLALVTFLQEISLATRGLRIGPH